MLPVSLTTAPKPIYLLTSDEPLLLRDWLDEAREALHGIGFEEINMYQVETGFDWTGILEGSQNMSLFSSKKCHIIRFNSNKPGLGGASFISQILTENLADDLIILVMPGLDRAAKNSAWLRKINESGEVCELKPVYNNQLAGWISQRAAQKKIQLDQQAALYLADLTEGNLLATDQELEKLALAYEPGATINLEQIKENISRSARYTHYLLTEACLAGQSERALKILRGLQLEGYQPIQVQYALQNILQTLLQLKLAQQKNQLNEATWRSVNVWKNKQRLYGQALSRFSTDQLERFLQSCAKLDRINKGQQQPAYAGADWHALKMLVSSLVGIGQMKIAG
jgi:DNA polymerase-3 subunit delta